MDASPGRVGRIAWVGVLASTLWCAGVVPCVAQSEIAQIAAGDDPEERPPWRGSVVELRNTVGVIGLDPDAELTHDPYYAATLSFRPRWWFGDIVNVAAFFGLIHEFTEANTTTSEHETIVSDLTLQAQARQVLTIPGLEIAVTPDLRLAFPTGKASRGRSLQTAIGPGLALSRGFSLGDEGTLVLAYRARFTALLHRYTDASLETPFIPGDVDCRYSCSSGLRNTRYRVGQGGDIVYVPNSWLMVAIGYYHFTDFLYPRSPVSAQAEQGTETGAFGVSYEASDNTDVRFRSSFGIEVAVMPSSLLQLALGYETTSPQLAPDSTYYNPIYNRFSTVYFDLRLQVEGLVDAIEDL
ncbi:MAG: hypothetical protein AAGF12_39640 [Myxococcota bacterium]